MPKDNVICTRLDDETMSQLTQLLAHYRETQPGETWSKATVIERLIQRGHSALPKQGA